MTTRQVVRIERVDISRGADGWTVSPIWAGVDRPRTGGWRFGPRHKALAERLRRAILAGVVYEDPTAATDVNGKTFVVARTTVLARQANADLARLGF